MHKDKHIVHIWSVLCSKSIIDQDSNNLSLLNVTEQLNLTIRPEELKKDQPFQPGNLDFSFEIVTMLHRNKPIDKIDKCKLIIDLYDPNNTQIGKSSMAEVEFAKGIKRVRSRCGINGIAITAVGNYWFKVSVSEGKNTEIVAEIPLEVTVQPLIA